MKDRGIAIQSASGFVNISGLDNNETVSFYALDGKALGTAKSIDGNVSFSAKQGTVVVARIGKENVKIAVEQHRMDCFITDLKEYMEYYNNESIKLRLNGMSPVLYRKAFEQAHSY